MIGNLTTEEKINWQEQLNQHWYMPIIVVIPNAIGFSPFNLMFGRHSMLPIDIQFGVRTPDIVASTSHGYIQKLQRRLDWAYKTANEVDKKESECSMKLYD